MENLTAQELAMTRTLRKQSLEIAALTYENEQLKIALEMIRGGDDENDKNDKRKMDRSKK
ncbi:hypothetical protein D3H64_06015 [Atopobacter sp. AH10]|uniref:hypothetical protein n=1 Tax=Atopobacter sp. AH10 TaxID=2315861 RepID=UPI000EF2944F|nr:hypothetical protein [Atopobacter sp. AH10]RLK63147.1 hypothetical protein D3H64_06015 [Atopobacter sp. AH10]